MKIVNLKKIAVLYLFFIVLYGFVVSLFTSTVHIEVDEELYLSMARSFHYEGKFAVGETLVNYSCILYSMLISMAYYFYGSENVLLIMRLIGVVVMTSAIFPIWLMARKILKDENIALRATVFSMFFPFMFDTAYLMQEVLAYPLFLWASVLFLYAMDEGKTQYFVLSALFSTLCFFTKTYLFFIPIIVNFVQVAEIMKIEEKKLSVKKWKGIMIYDVTYILAFAALYVFPYITNHFEEGSNHYSSQFSHLFPITAATIVCAVSCSILYLAFFIVNTGIIPFAALIKKRRDSVGAERKFWDFIFMSVAFLILEIVVMIVLTEEGKVLMPHKYLFRYFQIFSVPMLLTLISLENETEERIPKTQKSILYAACGITLLYWLVMCQKTRHGIMDGHFFVLLENMNRLFPYMACAAVLALILIIFFVKGKKRLYRAFAIIAVAGFWLLNVIQLPYYTNVIAGGRNIEYEAEQMAEYVNENGISGICFVQSELASPYLRNCYGYFKQPFIVIGEEQIDEYANKGNYVFIAADVPGIEAVLEENKLAKVSLETEELYLYAKEDER